jgi:hypothetical protein
MGDLGRREAWRLDPQGTVRADCGAALLASVFERFCDPCCSLEGFDGLPRGHG